MCKKFVLFVSLFNSLAESGSMQFRETRFGARMETTGAAKRPYRAMKAQQGGQNACWLIH